MLNIFISRKDEKKTKNIYTQQEILGFTSFYYQCRN